MTSINSVKTNYTLRVQNYNSSSLQLFFSVNKWWEQLRAAMFLVQLLKVESPQLLFPNKHATKKIRAENE